MIVIMPGGFHPFHAGHASLYQSALKAFPNADIYVAATNDTKTRPFPFEIKEKLAQVAGVKPGHFVQVKSPFQAKEITQNYDPEKDVLVFVRSEKDRDEQPKPGGTKKDGSPAYFQPYTGKNMEPFGKHGYIAYLPTVEFGPGIKSATEIRNLWPQLNDRRKLAMVMSLYPKAKENQKLAQNIVKMLDLGMGAGEEINESVIREAKMSDIVKPLIKAFNLEHGDRDSWPLSASASSPRRWRRGDGSYYTDPRKIISMSDRDKSLQREFFKWLTQQPGVQPAGKIRGEFRSSDYSNAVKYKGLIFIDRGAYTEYTTPSRLRNSDVWHQKTDEGMFDMFKKKPTRDDFIREKLSQMSTEELRSQLRDYKGSIPGARESGSLVGGAVSDYANAIQRELDKRAFNDFTAKNPNWDKGMNEAAAGNVYSQGQAAIIQDLGNGYFLGDDSYDDDEGFTKEGYSVYYQEGPNEFRQIGHVQMSPYRNPPGHVENEIQRLISQDQPIDEAKDGLQAAYTDPETHDILAYAQQHYPEEPDLQAAFVKFVLRSLKHSKNDDERQDNEIELLMKRVNSLQDAVNGMKDKPAQKSEKVDESMDYLPEK